MLQATSTADREIEILQEPREVDGKDESVKVKKGPIGEGAEKEAVKI